MAAVEGKSAYVPLKDSADALSQLAAARNYGSVGPPSIAGRTATPEVDPSIYTDHGKGLIDFVLAYQPLDMDATQASYREVFETKLRAHGLYLEHADLAESQDGKTCFIKVHAPWDVLARMAEINKVRAPIRKSDIDESEQTYRDTSTTSKIIRLFCCGRNPGELPHRYAVMKEPPYFTMEFQRNKFKQYLTQDPNVFFTQAQRIQLVWDIIEMRTSISAADMHEIGVSSLLPNHTEGESVHINFLIKSGVYCAAYPLHDGDEIVNKHDKSRKPVHTFPLRPWLHETWARFGRMLKYQPLDQIRKYFGEKIALYFAWLGFYTRTLIPLSLVGFIVVIYGLLTFQSSPVVVDICDKMKDTVICRKCGHTSCAYSQLHSSCTYAKATAIFNNYVTVFYSLFAALWAVTFLEYWKRTQARWTAKWNCFDSSPEVEPPRAEYVSAAKTRRRHPITLEWEAYIPPRSRMQRVFTSVATVTFLVSLALAVITGVIIYKVAALVFWYNLHDPRVEMVGSDTFTMMTASGINAIAIMVLEKIYTSLAWKLTEREYPRTESQFENSFTYKMYIFQFVNYYATLFYLAFCQPVLAGSPKDDTFFTDRCPPAGCTFSVTTQLCTVLVVKQVINNIMEVGQPLVSNWWRRRKNIAETDANLYVRHEKDFDLAELPPLELFGEYFEMVMQFGFVTMFVAAFPLAPLLALFNNVIEIRIDARKFTLDSRRAIPQKATDIGSWFEILDMLVRLAVLTNAVLIAITTDIVDRFVYQAYYSEDGSLNGYVDWMLSHFDPKDWPEAKNEPEITQLPNGTTVHDCRYKGFYNPPGDQEYIRSQAWWNVWLAKFVFILVFEHIVFFTQSLIQYMVPDVPEKVSLHVQRNRYLEKMMQYQGNHQNKNKAVDEAKSDNLQEQKRQQDKQQQQHQMDPGSLQQPGLGKPVVPPKPDKTESRSGTLKRESSTGSKKKKAK